MRVAILICLLSVLASGCATPVVTDSGVVTYQGQDYVVQYVTFEGAPQDPRFSRNSAGLETRQPYYQVIVLGQAYRCSGGPETCREAVAMALRRQSTEDREDNDAEPSGGYGGGY